MRTLLLAIALSSVAAIAVAQDADMAEMSQAQTMLQTNIERILNRHNIDADIQALTLAQLAEIRGVVEQSASMSEQDLRSQLETIVTRR